MIARVLYTVFFLSGAAALIFQTLWFRLAGLTFGNSVWASSLVLASFMGGLALGNGLAARRRERGRRALRLYALLELLVAITGSGLVLLGDAAKGAAAVAEARKTLRAGDPQSTFWSGLEVACREQRPRG